MKEKNFWAAIKRADLFDHADRIESVVTPGFPDVVYGVRGFTGLLELKVERQVKRPLNKAFEPAQYAWHARAAGKIFAHCLLFCRNRAILLSTADLLALEAATAEELIESALWVGPDHRLNRFDGLVDKLEKLNEAFRMAKTRSA